METITITKEKLNKFVVCGKHYVSANMSKKSLLWIAVESLLELAIKKLKKVEREKDLIKIKYCKKTPTKHLDFNKQGNYQFNEEDQLKVLNEFDRIDQELIQMPVMIIKKGDYPEKTLSYDIRDSFKGIVLAADEFSIQNPDELKELLEKENERVEQEEDEPIEQE